jgi:hypothetical protein
VQQTAVVAPLLDMRPEPPGSAPAVAGEDPDAAAWPRGAGPWLAETAMMPVDPNAVGLVFREHRLALLRRAGSR